jgi:hypothetical protein
VPPNIAGRKICLFINVLGNESWIRICCNLSEVWACRKIINCERNGVKKIGNIYN